MNLTVLSLCIAAAQPLIGVYVNNLMKNENKNKEDIPTPLILIVEGYYFIQDDGTTRLRVKDVKSLESLRILNARKITLNFTSKVLEENLQEIDEIMLRNRLNTKDIDQELAIADDESKVIKGCSLSLIIDNTLMKIRDDKYRFLPSDDLVEGIRDLAGSQSVRISF